MSGLIIGPTVAGAKTKAPIAFFIERKTMDYFRLITTNLKSRQIKVIQQEELNLLIVEAQKGDINSRNRIIEVNIGLIINEAKKWAGSIGYEDAFQEGVTGIIKAINKFDVKKGFKFSTYAIFWIRQAIYRYYVNSCFLIRLPIYKYEEKGDKPKIVYLDNPDMYLELSKNAKDVELSLDIELFDFLNEREKYVLQMWLNGYDGQIIAKKLEISRERVRQIRVKALEKIRLNLDNG